MSLQRVEVVDMLAGDSPAVVVIDHSAGPSVVEVDNGNQPTIVEINQGPSGDFGAISTATGTNLTGYFYGDGTHIAGATPGSTSATANNIAIRDASGNLTANAYVLPDGANTATIDNATLTASRTYTLPNASGTVTLTTNANGANDHTQIYAKAAVPITAGQAVYISGADGVNKIITLAQANTDPTSSKTIGIAVQSLAHNDSGYVVTEGDLKNLSISLGSGHGVNNGDPIWLSPTTAGGLLFGLANKPSAPDHLVFLGIVTRITGNTLRDIFVKVQNGFELEELHDVAVNNPVTGQSLIYDSEDQLWKNGGVSVGYWYSPDPVPISQNAVAIQIEASGAVTEGQPIPNNISITITYNGPAGTHSYTLNLTSGTVFDSTAIATSLASGLDAVIIFATGNSTGVFSYQNYICTGNGSYSFNALSETSLTCNYGTDSYPANYNAGVIQYCNYIPSLLGDFIVDDYTGIRQWECSSVNPIVWTEITTRSPVTVSSSTDILTVGNSNNLTFSLAFGDGIAFDNPTNAISCNTNIARRAGNQTFTGNNNFGTVSTGVTTTFFGTQTFNGIRTLAGTSTFSGQVELTGQSATNSTSALTRALGDARYGTTQSIATGTFTSSSNTLNSSLSITLGVGSYEFSAFIVSAHDSVAGCQIRLGTSNPIRVGLTDSYGRQNVAGLNEAIIDNAYDNSNASSTRSDTGATSFRRTITGNIDVITPNTVISWDYAQAVTTPASPSTARIRRHLIARKLN